MNKLIEAFTANPSAKTAARLLKHLDKHPMTACFLCPVIREAAKELVK